MSVKRYGDDHRSPNRVERKPAPVRTPPTAPAPPAPKPTPPAPSDGASAPSTQPVTALERDPVGTTSDAAAARPVTRRQSQVSALLTTSPEVSFDTLSAEDRRLANLAEEAEQEREDAAAEGRTLLRDGEYINPSDAHLHAQAEAIETEREAAAAEGRTVVVNGEYVNPSDVHLHNLAGDQEAEAQAPAESATALGQDIQDAENPEQLIEQQVPEILASLEDAEPEVVSATLAQFSQIAHDNPELAEAIAQQFGEHPPQNLSATLEGLASSSAAGRPELAGAIATLFENEENPSASQFRSVADLSDAVSDINTALEPGGLPGAGQAADRISAAIQNAPPEVAQALLNQLGVDGSLEQITGILDQAANEDGLDGEYASFDDGEVRINDPTVPLGENPSSLQIFDRVIGSLSQAVTAAEDDELTTMVAGHVTNAIGDSDIRRFDEAFGLSIGHGGGAGLAGAVATQLVDSNPDMANKVAEAVEDGSQIFLDRFDSVADQVDTANADLSYLLTQWGPFYGEDEAGQAALNEQVQAFQEAHPEYAQIEGMADTVGGDLEVLRELQSVFPDKGHLRDRELDLLAEVPRIANTDAGRRVLGEAAERRGQGEPTFLDRLDDQDFIDSLPEDYYQKLGYENRESFDSGFGQQLLNGSLALQAESASQGDMESLDNIQQGLLESHELLGEDREVLSQVLDANRDLITQSINLAKEGTGASDEGLEAAVAAHRLATGQLANPATANRFAVGGAITGVAAGSLSWWAASRDGLEVPEALSASVDTLEGLLDVGGAANARSGGRILSQFTDDFVTRGGKFFGAAGAVLDAYSFVRAAQEGDWAQAGISAISVAGGIATALGATGVGLALGIGAAVVGLGYAQYKKVEASNRYESAEAEAFIRGALEHAGVENDQLDEVVRHLRNADDEGRQVGVLISQAAASRGMDPIELLTLIAQQSPGDVLDIVEAGHGVDPQSGDLSDLPQTHEDDSQVGERTHPRAQPIRPESVEGFLVYLENQGIL